MLSELENSAQELHLYFLTVSPTRNRTINKFIEDTILKHNNGHSLKVTIVNEKQADKFVAGVKKEIEEHQD